MNEKYYKPITYSQGATLKEVLQGHLEKEFKGVKNSDCLLILSALCGLISPEEVSTLFPFVSYNYAFKQLASLTSEGKMVRVTLYHKNKEVFDGRTSVLFSLSKDGFKYVKEKYLPNLRNYKKPSDKYACHDYGMSWNFMAMIACPYVPSIRGLYSELLFDDGKAVTRVSDDSLRIDGTALVDGDTVYIEEDRDTESIGVLRDKFKIYGYQGFNLAKNNSFVVLSIKEPFVNPMDPNYIRHGKNVRFSVKHLKAAVELFKIHPEIKRKGVLQFDDLYKKIAAGEIPHSSLTELVEELYRDCDDVGYTQFEDTTEERPGLLSFDGLIEDHLKELKGYRSSIYCYEYAKHQEEFCTKKRNALLEAILADGVHSSSTRDNVAPDIQYYLYGFRLFIGPTYMIDKVYFFAFYEKTGIKEIMERTIEQYIPNIDVTSYRADYVITANSPLKRSDAPINVFDMRNGYESPRWVIFVENLAYDLSAAVRLKAAMECFNQKRTGSQGVLIVCLVRNQKEAKYFYDLLDMSRNVRPNSDLNIVFIDICPVLEWIHPDGSRLMYDKLDPQISPLYGLNPSGKRQIVNVSKHYKEKI